MASLSKALFLDRDGIINIDYGYVYNFDQFKLIPEIISIIKLAKANNYKLVVLTNQSGIERGYYADHHVQMLHLEIDHLFLCHGITIDAWYFCPSLSGEWRKPRPGMMIQAAKDLSIDLNSSLMLGDKESDILEISGPKYFLIQGNYQFNSMAIKEKAHVFEHHQDFLVYFKKTILQS